MSGCEQMQQKSKNILLIITGGIAAYKSLYLIRLLRQQGHKIRVVMTQAATQFVTPLSAAALSEHEVYTDLWSLKDETEMGHIRLSRECDLIIIAPASADFLAKMAHGMANDLASTLVLASDKPILVAPAMNVQMWQHPATQHNITLLRSRGITMLGPDQGIMACGETGSGRMVEPEFIAAHINQTGQTLALTGKKVLVTSGPTYEPIDPVRFLGNYSSGRQGHAIAEALARRGAAVTLITGPVALADPPCVTTLHVQTARDMLDACMTALPCDIAICAAAVADWRPADVSRGKIKKNSGAAPPAIQLVENPDILRQISQHPDLRPQLVIGFAAETGDIATLAPAKRLRKGCDWILANDVGHGSNVFGGPENQVFLIDDDGITPWPRMTKIALAETLTDHIITFFNQESLQ